MAICDPRDIPDWVRAAFPDDFAKPEPLRGMDPDAAGPKPEKPRSVLEDLPWEPADARSPLRYELARPLLVVGSYDQFCQVNKAIGCPERTVFWLAHPETVFFEDFDFVVYGLGRCTAAQMSKHLKIIEDIRRCSGARQISVEEAEGRPGMTPERICDSDAALGAMLRGTFMEQYLPDRDMLPDGRWVIRRPNGSVEIVDVHHQTVNNLPLTEFLERRGPEPTRTIPRICGWERRDATEPARRHGNYRYMREMQRLSQDVTGIRQPARRHGKSAAAKSLDDVARSLGYRDADHVRESVDVLQDLPFVEAPPDELAIEKFRRDGVLDPVTAPAAMTPERALDELAAEAQRMGLYDEPPTVSVPRIEGNRRADATEPARVHENVHNLGTESGKPQDHRMGWKPGD